MKKNFLLTTVLSSFVTCLALFTLNVSAQKGNDALSQDYLDLPWKKVATGMPDEWYGTEQAKAVADNVVFSQHIVGGWSKNKPYHHPLSEQEKLLVQQARTTPGATFDNGATITEMKFLTKVFQKLHDERYAKAFDYGLDYIFLAQYKNGGWPQFFPLQKGKYSSHITFNDNAMVNVMTLLKDVAESNPFYKSLDLTADQKLKARNAYEKGIDCILKTQIRINGLPTVWCAQHDEVTLAPAKARAYELPSFSGSESVGIVLLLMDVQNPSKEIIESINGAVKWFEAHKITGIRVDHEDNGKAKPNLIITEDKDAPPQWARFYDLETGKPFFSDRDGVKKATVAELSAERRNGYSWYITSPDKVLKKYPEWKMKWNVQ